MVVIWKITDEQLPIRAIEATDVLPPGTEKIVNSITLDPGEEGDITVKKGLQQDATCLPASSRTWTRRI